MLFFVVDKCSNQVKKWYEFTWIKNSFIGSIVQVKTLIKNIQSL